MSPVKVLVVDDLSDMRMLIGLTLRRNKWSVLEAKHGEHAIEVAQSEHPDVILMDYDMPTMNGLEACQALTTNPDTKNIPVIIYTGYSASHIRDDALNAGAKDFLLKPITPTKLRKEIESVLGSH